MAQIELRSKGIQVKHVYEPLISKELWDKCQQQRKIQAAKPFNIGDLKFLYRGVFQDYYQKQKTCPCELKKKKFRYVVSYKGNGTRVYTPERIIDNQMLSILDQITVPDKMITDFQDYVQANQQAEVNFINSEIERLKSEIEHIDKQLNRLFELRMSEEISKKEYQTRKADYNLQRSRLQTQLEVKYRGDDGFNVTVLNSLKILSKAKDIFTATTRSLTDKQMLLRLLFKQIVLQEGVISCILNQPFSFILSYDVLKATGNDTAPKTESFELQEYQGLQADLGGISDGLSEKPTEPYTAPHNSLIYKEKNCSEKQFIKIGWGGNNPNH